MAMAVDDELAVRGGNWYDGPYAGRRTPKRWSPATFGDGLGAMNSDASTCGVSAFVDRARVEQLNGMDTKINPRNGPSFMHANGARKSLDRRR